MEKARILIIDDTIENLEVLGAQLLPEYRVSFATNGLEGIELASSDTPPDLILLDIMMPGIDGYQVCTTLKSKEETKHIPIIFVTAMHEMESEEKGLELGAVDYITKPFSPSIVLARVKTHLSLYNQRRLLQDLVHERTRELEKSRDEANSANRAKSTFLSNMSHELRTPLNGILGITQILMEETEDQENRVFLGDVEGSAKRLLAMVNDLLELSRAETGNIELSPAAFNLRRNFEAITAHYKKRAVDKGLEFDVVFEEGLPESMRADAGRIRQVVMNLLNNALQFTTKGRIELDVKRFNSENRTNQSDIVLLIEVKDTGVGIDPDKAESLFEPFVIGEDFMTKRHSGAGLGLTISKRLVNCMGGHIWITPIASGGTIVRFTVPSA